ncbi:non-homologous end joining protein Ku [Cellulomonas sp. P4]|uniref:non-homologous end joining protein Ku n=1 Tax=Cellulomonas sp. P4 TaxID=3142533 RepID=UPI0031BA8577
MRAIWKGAVAFGLVNVPVKLYAATGEHEVPLHQVHKKDGGRIRYKKFCSIEDEQVEYSEIAKGYETDDGQLVVLTDEDLDRLPLATEREIEVLEFVPSEQVDPILLAKTYYLEPDRTAAKPYALLREALTSTDRMAVVKVALRQRESMAVLRVRDDVICLQTLLWPDEVREADFPILDQDVTVRPQELAMASSLVESLAGDFDPSGFEDRYRAALEEVIEQKVSAGRTQSVPQPEEPAEEGGSGEVVDLLAALQRSVEKARAGRGEGAGAAADAGTDAEEADTGTDAEEATGTTGRSRSRKPAASGGKASSSGRSSGRTASAAKKPAAKKPATQDGEAAPSGRGRSRSRAQEEAPAEEKPTRTRRKRAS